MLRHLGELVLELLVLEVVVVGDDVAGLVDVLVELAVVELVVLPPGRRARHLAIARARPLAGEADSEWSLDDQAPLPNSTFQA